MDDGLTIVSVNYGTPAHLWRNLRLTRRLNPETILRWLVVDNGPEFTLDARYDFVTVLRGEPPFRRSDKGSYHHAQGLHRATREVKTRYVLYVDPDFFVVRPNWIRELMAHVDRRGLCFFGSQWHPRWWWQYRHAPSIHFLLVDLEKVPPDSLSFEPAIEPFLRRTAWLRGGCPWLYEQLFRGRFPDTGYRIRRHWMKGDTPIETLTLFYPEEEERRRAGPWTRWATRVLPEPFSPLPRQTANYTPLSFLPLSLPEGVRQRWEQFFWRDRPFAFHLRSVAHPGAADHELPWVDCALEGTCHEY